MEYLVFRTCQLPVGRILGLFLMATHGKSEAGIADKFRSRSCMYAIMTFHT